TGATALNNGTLKLDYSSGNFSKLADGGVLTLGGGALVLSGGSHTEVVGSTTLAAGTVNTVTQTGGTSVLRMNTVTAGAGSTVNFSASSIADTDTLNTNGILPWATVAGADWGTNS